MSNRADNPVNRPHRPRLLALVDADVNQHHTVREYFAGPEVGWHVDTYPTTQTAWPGLASAPPCVVLMDVAPPTATGLGCLRNLRARLPDVPVVVYTAQDCAGMLLWTMSAGARGYLVKPLPVADLLPHLHKALAGGVAFCPRAERLLAEAFALMRQRTVNQWGLTRREEEILTALCAHKTEKEIGVELRIETGTVHVHLMKIYKKLAVHDRASAIRNYLAAMRGGKPTLRLAQQHLSLYTIFIPSGGLPCV